MQRKDAAIKVDTTVYFVNKETVTRFGNPISVNNLISHIINYGLLQDVMIDGESFAGFEAIQIINAIHPIEVVA